MYHLKLISSDKKIEYVRELGSSYTIHKKGSSLFNSCCEQYSGSKNIAESIKCIISCETDSGLVVDNQYSRMYITNDAGKTVDFLYLGE